MSDWKWLFLDNGPHDNTHKVWKSSSPFSAELWKLEIIMETLKLERDKEKESRSIATQRFGVDLWQEDKEHFKMKFL